MEQVNINPRIQHHIPTRHTLPAVMMRAGTSKGLFIHRKDLPKSEDQWATPLLAVMGSQGNDARQIDGVGGATSTTSKVAVVAPSQRPGVDVDYTFVQVAVGQEVIDFTGNCGNMASGVGPFALLEGLVRTTPGDESVDVKIFNTNTNRLLVSTLQLHPDGTFKEEGSCLIPGVKSPASEVRVAFVKPAGSMTNVLFPSNQRVQSLPVQQRHSPFFSVRATLIDAANPFVLVDASSLPAYLRSCPQDAEGYLEQMEAIRRAGAVAMGLAKTVEAAGKTRGTPKLALVSPARSRASGTAQTRLRVQAFSMGKPHPSLQLTGAVCIASAACIDGTVAYQVAQIKDAVLANIEGELLPTPERTPSPVEHDTAMGGACRTQKQVCIEHSAGSIDVDVDISEDRAAGIVEVNKCTVLRTARQLFKGEVFYYQ